MGKEMGNLREKLAHMKKNQWLVLVLAGILLLVIAIPVPGESEKKTQEVLKAEAEGGGEMELLEKRLERALADVEGVGRVRVMLTRKSSGRKIVEKDTPVMEKNTAEEGNEGSKSTVEKTAEEATVYAQDGNGSQIPYVTEEIEPQIQGVIVVAEGGGDPRTARNITEAVMALFGVEAHKIKVMKMN